MFKFDFNLKNLDQSTKIGKSSNLEVKSTCFLLSLWYCCCAAVLPINWISFLFPVFESVNKNHTFYLLGHIFKYGQSSSSKLNAAL